MPVPGEMARVDLVWSIENKEIAVNALWLQHVHHDTVEFSWGDALQTITDKVVSSLNTSGAGHGVLGWVSNNCKLARVDAYQVGPDGHATDKRTTTVTVENVTGSGGSAYIPLVGAVVQLWGYDPAGFSANARRHRGRIFAPCTPDALFANTGELSPSNAGSMASDWGAFLNDLQGMHVGNSAGIPGGPTDSMNVGVFSRTDSAFRQLQAVTVSLKPGIQRRRMNKLANGRGASVAINH